MSLTLSTKAFHVKVPLKEMLMRGLIFGIKARLPIGLILGFVGYCHQVMPMMQSISHSTRAYIFNSNGLPGFISRFSILKLLKDAENRGYLNYAKQWQLINFEKLMKDLEILQSVDKALDHL